MDRPTSASWRWPTSRSRAGHEAALLVQPQGVLDHEDVDLQREGGGGQGHARRCSTAAASRRRLTVDLFFDAFKPDASTEGDVVGIAGRADEAPAGQARHQRQEGAARPGCMFNWGEAWTFKSYVESLTIQYLRFAPTGKPIRMLAKLKLKQMEKETLPRAAAAAPTRAARTPPPSAWPASPATSCATATRCSRSPSRTTSDPTRWRAIAEANGIDDPMRLRRGAQLTIPDGRDLGACALAPGFQLKIGGADATPDLNVSEIRVEDNLMAPDTCTLRHAGAVRPERQRDDQVHLQGRRRPDGRPRRRRPSRGRWRRCSTARSCRWSPSSRRAAASSTRSAPTTAATG